MKKIMFSDRYGLTEAVLQGRKTMTRRMVKDGTPLGNWGETEKYAYYKIGEVVAVAQSYKDAGIDPHFLMFQPVKGSNYFAEMEIEAMFTGGWNNKMFVRADLMPLKIQITDIKVERLQDISNEDCLKEGVQEFDTPVGKCYVAGGVYVGQDSRLKIAKGMINIAKPFKTPQEAFAVLIDRVSGKGTWGNNPYVFCYSFANL